MSTFYLFYRESSGCLESLEAYLSMFTHKKFSIFLDIGIIIDPRINVSGQF